MAHIRQRPDMGEGVWQVVVSTGRDPVTGRYRQTTRTVKAGPPTAKGLPPRQVTQLASKLEAEAGEGRHRGSKVTLGYLLDQYVDYSKARGRAPRTVAGYESLCRQICDPDGLGQGIHRIGLKKLTSHDLDAFDRRLALAGKSQTTRAHYSSLLAQALRQAVKWGWLDRSPATGADRPVIPPTVAEVRRLIDAARRGSGNKYASRGGHPMLACLIFVASALGARRGELSRLRWSDVDLAAGYVVFRYTKTKRVRRVAIGEATADVFRELHHLGTQRATLAGLDRLPASAYVWSVSVDHTTPWTPDSMTQAFTRLREREKLPHVHLHSLRHMAVSRALEAGLDVKTASTRFGHDPSLMLRTYAHAIEGADRAAAAAGESGLT
jgi:integrase